MNLGVVFSFQRQQDIDKKGNLSYVRHYGNAFEAFTFLNLIGKGPTHDLGNGVQVRSIGFESTVVSLLLSPISLAQEVRRLQRLHKLPAVLMTADQWYSFWTTFLLRLARYQFALIPVCIPEVIYRTSGGAPSGLPRWADRIVRLLSMMAASALVVTKGQDEYVRWAKSSRLRRRKMVLVDVLAESLPSLEFIEQTNLLTGDETTQQGQRSSELKFVFVGRLHSDKNVDHILRAFGRLDRDDLILEIVGDGPDRSQLERLAVDLKIKEKVTFRGPIPNDRIAPFLKECDIFISTLTGTSLREAAASGLAIVAYDVDWVSSSFDSGIDAILVPWGAIDQLAEALSLVAGDWQLRYSLSKNSRTKAQALWCRTLSPCDVAPISEALRLKKPFLRRDSTGVGRLGLVARLTRKSAIRCTNPSHSSEAT